MGFIRLHQSIDAVADDRCIYFDEVLLILPMRVPQTSPNVANQSALKTRRFVEEGICSNVAPNRSARVTARISVGRSKGFGSHAAASPRRPKRPPLESCCSGDEQGVSQPPSDRGGVRGIDSAARGELAARQPATPQTPHH